MWNQCCEVRGDRMVLCGVSVVKCGVTGWCCVECVLCSVG